MATFSESPLHGSFDWSRLHSRFRLLISQDAPREAHARCGRHCRQCCSRYALSTTYGSPSSDQQQKAARCPRVMRMGSPSRNPQVARRRRARCPGRRMPPGPPALKRYLIPGVCFFAWVIRDKGLGTHLGLGGHARKILPVKSWPWPW